MIRYEFFSFERIMKLKIEICNAFNQAVDYEQAAKVQREIGEQLFERLHYLKIEPRYVLDLGCGTGIFTQLLTQRYPKATIIGFDISSTMLLQSRQKQGWRRKWHLVNGDMEKLPFATHSFDLIFANQAIHWSLSVPATLRELNRVMNAQGCLMFSTLGPDTFKELRQAWSFGDHYAHVNDFVDMHNVGDCLLAERFLDPVIDMDMLTVHYATLKHLLKSLKAQGVRNINQERNKGLTGKQAWFEFEHAYKALSTIEGKYPLTYEVVYGHAWKGEQQFQQGRVETFIPVSHILRG